MYVYLMRTTVYPLACTMYMYVPMHVHVQGGLKIIFYTNLIKDWFGVSTIYGSCIVLVDICPLAIAIVCAIAVIIIHVVNLINIVPEM